MTSQESPNSLLELVRCDVPVKRVASTYGGEWVGPCPWCHGNDRFHVWPNHPSGKERYWCRQCNKSGDAIQYLRDYKGLTFPDAVAALGGTMPRRALSLAPKSQCRPTAVFVPPSSDWQRRGLAFVAECEQRLWSDRTAPLDALRVKRGLTDDTIRTARLGYNPTDRWEPSSAWGLDDGKKVWLPRGWGIPWFVGGQLVKVNIRRPGVDVENDPNKRKYIQVRGSANALYNTDTMTGGPAVLVEGEFDALVVQQWSGDFVAGVATGSTAGARSPRWLGPLAACEKVLVAFDNDDGGEKSAQFWLDYLSNAKRWRPWSGNDVTDYALKGGDVRAWVLAGLGKTDASSDTKEVLADITWVEGEYIRVPIDEYQDWLVRNGLEHVSVKWADGTPWLIATVRHANHACQALSANC